MLTKAFIHWILILGCVIEHFPSPDGKTSDDSYFVLKIWNYISHAHDMFFIKISRV